MLRPAAILLITILACTVVSGQQATVRRDTQLPVELSHSVKTKSAKVGDRVKFRLNEPVLIGNNIVVPEGAKIFGTIEEVQNDAPGEIRSWFRLRILSLEWKKGNAPLNAVVQSVEPSPAQDLMMIRRRHRPLQVPSFMLNIRIRAHVRRDAYTEFYSKEKDFVLRSGVVFMLRQIDPTREPAMMGNERTNEIHPR